MNSEHETTPRRVKIMIVDDQPLMQESLATLLSTEPTFEIVAQPTSGKEAVDQITTIQPDIVLMDIEMPDINGLEATRQLKRKYPECEVVMLTAYEGQHYLRQALTSGASGYILKTTDVRNLVNAIKTIASGGSLISPVMLRNLIQEFATNQAPQAQEIPKASQALLNSLTRREKEVLVLIGQGLSNALIAQNLSISPDTVKSHVRAILEKLEVKDRTQAAVFAVRNRLTD